MLLESNGVAADGDDEDDEFAVTDLARKESLKLFDQLMALAAMMLKKER